MVNPVGGPSWGDSSSNDAIPQNVIWAMNNLWACSYKLPGSSPQDFFDFQTSMKSILNFLNAMPSTPDAATQTIVNDIKNGVPSLESLATQFKDDPEGAWDAFQASSSAQGAFSKMGNDVHNWWNAEGDPSGTGATKYVGNLSRADLALIDSDVSALQKALTNKDAAGIQTALANLQSDLGELTPPLDGYCQGLSDLLGNTVVPGDSDYALTSLSADQIKELLLNNPSNMSSLSSFLSVFTDNETAGS